METKAAVEFDASHLNRWVDLEIAEGRMAGCAVEVVSQGISIHRNSHGCRTSTGDPATLETQFWIASMTKPVVSITAMHLVEAGWLNLQDPVSEFVPGFGEAGVLLEDGSTEPASRPVTVHDLLIHTAGITYGQFGDGPLHRTYKDAKVYDFSVANEVICQRLAAVPLMQQPGTIFEYGMSTDVLGRVIEVITGASLDEALRSIVFGPLKMRDTGFKPEMSRVADFPDSSIKKKLPPDFSSSPVWFSGGAGLFSTVHDYVRFTRLLREKGAFDGARVVSPDTFDLMVQQHLPSNVSFGEYTPALGITAPWPPNGLGFGLGFAVRLEEVEETPGGVGEFFWPGVSGCNFWVDPENDLIVVFLTHAPDYRTEHRVGLKRAIYAGLPTAGPALSGNQAADLKLN
ncbi:serine hydrolase domain-containing protein [Pacificoceanicola onchidii]|uniref:serine hydrolase domain-containing protein n=1 Tax=Pacificoceanicola onchidii TaxID=2562685 RepID=UPI0010A5EDED|nr:serine hydrolase domain-containing protein [Pacificoceanicola onchidii]